MKRTIRRGVFETNSSSSHSLTIKKMTKDEKNVVEEEASFEIRTPLAKAVQIIGLIDNAERDYKSYIYYLDDDEDVKRQVVTSIVERIKKINHEVLEGYEIDKITYEDLSNIFLKLIENRTELYDFFDEDEAPYSLAFTVYNRNKAIVKRFAAAMLDELAKLLNITVEQVKEEIEFEAFGSHTLREILKDEATAEEKLKEYLNAQKEYDRFRSAYEKSGETDIVAFAKRFYIEDMQEIKGLMKGRISCELYFGNGCLNDCGCGFESYFDIENKLGLDFYMSDEEVREKARDFLLNSKFLGREMYCGLIFEQSGEIF